MLIAALHKSCSGAIYTALLVRLKGNAAAREMTCRCLVFGKTAKVKCLCCLNTAHQ